MRFSFVAGFVPHALLFFASHCFGGSTVRVSFSVFCCPDASCLPVLQMDHAVTNMMVMFISRYACLPAATFRRSGNRLWNRRSTKKWCTFGAQNSKYVDMADADDNDPQQERHTAQPLRHGGVSAVLHKKVDSGFWILRSFFCLLLLTCSYERRFGNKNVS